MLPEIPATISMMYLGEKIQIDLEYQSTLGGGFVIYRILYQFRESTGMFVLLTPNGAAACDGRAIHKGRGCFRDIGFHAKLRFRLNKGVLLPLPATDGRFMLREIESIDSSLDNPPPTKLPTATERPPVRRSLLADFSQQMELDEEALLAPTPPEQRQARIRTAACILNFYLQKYKTNEWL